MESKTLVFVCLLICSILAAYPHDTCASDLNRPVLVRIDLADAQELALLQNIPLDIHLISHQYVLASVPSERLGVLAKNGLRYEALEEWIAGQSYWLISQPHNMLLGDFPKLGNVLYRTDREAIVKLSEEAAQELRARGFHLYRIPKQPLPARYSQAESAFELPVEQAADPIIGALVARVSDAAIQSALQRLQDFRTRWSGSDSVYSASQWIADQFGQYGYTDVVFDTLETIVEGKLQRNVIATKLGTTNPKKLIIIGGHYDSVVYDGTNPAIWAPGVDDDGTGTVAAMEAARILADIDLQNTVIFACWAAEEQGLIGSADWVIKANAKNLDIGLYLNFDMIGNIDKNDPVRNVSIYAEPINSVPAQTMKQMALLYTTLKPEVYSAGWGSDHVPFWQSGYNFAYAEEGDFSPNWHKRTDTMESVQISYVNEVIKMGLATLIQAAGPPANLSGPYMTYNSNQLDDDASGQSHGNANGYLDAGETIELAISLANIGETEARDVTLALDTDDAFVQITDSLKNYGNLAAGDSTTNSESFVFVVSPQTPNDHAILFTLKVRDALGNAWNSNLTLKVVQPKFTYLDSRLVEITGDGDKVPEPGEIFELHISLANQGLRPAAGVSATLTTEDPDIIMLENKAEFTNIPVDSVGDNHAHPFTFAITEGASLHGVQFRLRISEGKGFYTEELGVQVLLGQEPILLVRDDGKSEEPTLYWEVLRQMGAPVRVWQVTSQGKVPTDTLLQYAEVIWFTGVEGRETLSEEEQTSLSAYLDQGGCLLLSGDFIGYRLRNSSFYSEYLHAKLANAQPQLRRLRGVQGNSVTLVDTLALRKTSFPTEIDPLPPAERILAFDQSTPEGPGVIKSSGTAALAYTNGDHKVVYCSFSVESIASLESRMAFIADVLSWFKKALPPSAVATAPGQTTPAEFDLQQNYPNPFSSTKLGSLGTSIKFQLPQAEDVTLKIFNMLGQEVATLVKRNFQAGYHQVIWDGHLQNGQLVANGIYFYQIQAGNFRQMRKMLVMH